jgi:hypothetical protein
MNTILLQCFKIVICIKRKNRFLFITFSYKNVKQRIITNYYYKFIRTNKND